MNLSGSEFIPQCSLLLSYISHYQAGSPSTDNEVSACGFKNLLEPKKAKLYLC